MTLNKAESILAVKDILSKDMNTDPHAFDCETVTVNLAEVREGRRWFDLNPKHFQVMLCGNGSVLSVDQMHMDWVNKNLSSMTRDEFLSLRTLSKIEKYLQNHGLTLYGPDLKFICDPKSFQPFMQEDAYDYEMIKDVVSLYKYPGFNNAISYQVDKKRKDVLGVICKEHGIIIGVAGASKDCEAMYQIGIDVKEAYRNKKIGKKLVSMLTEALFKQNIIPYYSTALGNLSSSNLALSLGYYPMWIELYTR